jgi:hypothetical protein
LPFRESFMDVKLAQKSGRANPGQIKKAHRMNPARPDERFKLSV